MKLEAKYEISLSASELKNIVWKVSASVFGCDR